MAETKEITRLYVVTDSETSYDNIGDIDGGMFQDEWLRQHIENHGTVNLITRLAGMITQVIQAERQLLREKQDQPVHAGPFTANPS